MGHGVGGVDVEREYLPFVGVAFIFGGAGVGGAGFNRQQHNASIATFFVQQLGWAHGGAPGAGRQQALLISGKKDGIDEL